MSPSYPPPPRRVDDIADRLAFVGTVAGGVAVVVALWWLRPLWTLAGGFQRRVDLDRVRRVVFDS